MDIRTPVDVIIPGMVIYGSDDNNLYQGEMIVVDKIINAAEYSVLARRITNDKAGNIRYSSPGEWTLSGRIWYDVTDDLNKLLKGDNNESSEEYQGIDTPATCRK